MLQSSPDLRTTRVLLLNASYEPMKVVSWQRALIMWFQDKADILEYQPVYVRSVSRAFQIPSVIRLRSYVKQKQTKLVRFSRENVYLRDDFTCQYCATKLGAKQLTLDHVVPASLKGQKNWTNMVSACKSCNQKKANRTPHTANMPLLKEPRAPTWISFFEVELRQEKFPSSWLTYLGIE